MPNRVIEAIAGQLAYNPSRPMVFHTPFFLISFIILLVGYQLLQGKQRLKIVYLLCYSVYFYYKSSGLFVILLMLTAATDFMLAYAIHRSQAQVAKRFYLLLSVLSNLAILAYFKYGNFLVQNFGWLSGRQFPHYDITLPVGVSFFTFQALSYTIDVFRGQLKPIDDFSDFAFFVTFFPQLVAGPIVRASDFLPQIPREQAVTKDMVSRGLYLVVIGLLKKAVVADYLSVNFVDRVFDNPGLYTGAENLLATYAYAMQIFCDFSGYSDIAIGVALFLGFELCVNFDSPYKAHSLTDFWHRWHISLSTWLRDYLYIPLGGNRKGKARSYINQAITMLLGGLWHGADWKFVIWGALHGLGLGAEKALGLTARPKNPWLALLRGFFTFQFVCLAWVFFRASSFFQALKVLGRIFSSFQVRLIPKTISSYSLVFILLALAYALHLLPKKAQEGVKKAIISSPLPLQAAYLCLSIWLVIQFKSAEVQPFIYFQF